MVAIILARIAKYYKDKEIKPPVFVFRSSTDWFKEITEFAHKENLLSEEITDIRYTELVDFFYEFSSHQQGCISIDNIRRASKLTEDEFEDNFLSVLE